MKKYYRVFFRTTTELKEKLGKFITYHAKDIVKEVANIDIDEIKKVPIEVADKYYNKTTTDIAVYIDKETYDKWRNIPRYLKKQAQYLINQKLSEIAKKQTKEKLNSI